MGRSRKVGAARKSDLLLRRVIAKPFSETVVAAVLGVVVYAIDRSAGTAMLTLAFGLVLSVSRQAFARTVSRHFVPLVRLAKWVDMSRQIQLPQFHQIANIYIQILEPDFQWLKKSIVEEAASHLQQLATQKRSRELATSEYYHWLYAMLDDQHDGEIWAVSTMNPLEWDDSQTERKFVEHNENAVGRGAELTRVFIVPRAEKQALLKNPAASWQLRSTPRVKGYVVIREELEKRDNLLLKELGDGFIAFDRRVAMVDVFTSDGSARGYVSMNELEIQTLRHKFEQLLTHGELQPQSVPRVSELTS